MGLLRPTSSAPDGCLAPRPGGADPSGRTRVGSSRGNGALWVRLKGPGGRGRRLFDA
ncbi:uncharacterized protein GLRG_04481 [Colletotrichum graminicola M1.001]|uniref:Uncharacterized protein n=1 Tax=Colletotrichum graminicola (strain M1.001 / M2 / FGSC 10212) TaxID=645133 RepID=E3QEN1_COLGM|nr:uncharacterized protein GLRG_04481 [Colletotrichum graminicola M1.001]EFQ29337.1 hypothetical protein GLRG_04481 [Colletotrichum graminicola M1.001]